VWLCKAICVDEILEHCRVSGAWRKPGVLRETEVRSQGRSADTFKTVYRLSVWLPPSICEADSSRLGFPAYDLHAILGLPSTLGVARMSKLRTCCRQLQVRFARRPQSPDDASVAVQGCLLMQATPQPCTRPVNFSLAVLDSSNSNEALLHSACSSCKPTRTQPRRPRFMLPLPGPRR
jgi:hypothetical protein